MDRTEQREELIYCVYMHTSPSNKRYIGITSKKPEYRWANGKGYAHNDYFYRAIKKYGWDNFYHDLICEGLTKEQAEQMEIELISKFDSANPQKGYNLDLGGNSIGKRSEATKKKLSEISKAKATRYWQGKHLSEEHKRHCVEARRLNGSYNTSAKARKVYCDGMVFPSATACAKYYGRNYKTISDYCNGSKKIPDVWKERGLKYIDQEEI